MGAADFAGCRQMMDELSDVRQVPQGMLRITAALVLDDRWWLRRYQRWRKVSATGITF